MSQRLDWREPEEVDAKWLADEAKRRADEFAEFKATEAKARKQAREALDLDQRRRTIVVAISKLPVNQAGSVSRSSPSADGVGLPQGGSQYEVGHLHAQEVAKVLKLAFSASDAVALKAIERLEAAYDAHLGVGSQADVSQMLSVEKDKRIRKLAEEGLSPIQINTLEPWLGDVLCIRRVIAATEKAAA